MVPQINSYETDGGSLEKRRHLHSRIGLACCHAALEFDSKTRLKVNQIPVIHDDHIELGRLLGRGGFNEVLEVVAKQDESSEEEIWAVKRLHENTVKTQETFYAGAIDLVSEARILNALRHRHIIRLHGVSCDDASLKSSYVGDSKYSLYLDCLYGTVDEKFDEERRRYAPDQKGQDLIKRIETIALPIAEAMRYLHAHNLIYRDLKPTNMGFDANGTVKLFDFGLAREIPLDSNRLMTGATGSRRYMAPEVALSQPYGLPADVYSFGIFLFECCTLIKPFCGMSSSEHSERVALGGSRPDFHASCVTPKSIQKTVKSCWAQSTRARPDFVRVVSLIQRGLDGHAMEGKLKEQPSGPMNKIFGARLVASSWSHVTVRKAPRAA